MEMTGFLYDAEVSMPSKAQQKLDSFGDNRFSDKKEFLNIRRIKRTVHCENGMSFHIQKVGNSVTIPRTSIEKALDLLETVAAQTNGISLIELTKALNLPKTTVFRIASLLESRGYLSRNEHGYIPGLRLISLGFASLEQVNLRKAARSCMEKLAALTGETVHLSVRDNLEAVCVERVEGTNSVRLFMQVGRRAPLYKGSSAKVLLAYAGNEVQKAVLESIPTDEQRKMLLSQLADIREKGYVITRGDLDEYAIGIAAPIIDHSGKVVAAVSLAGLESRLGGTNLQDNITKVCECAKQISIGLGAEVPSLALGEIGCHRP